MKFVSRWLLLAVVVCAALVAPLAAHEAADPEVITLIPHTDEGYGIETVIPEGWTEAGNGIYMRSASPTDTTVLAQQAAPMNAESLLSALLPQLALTEAPESVGSYSGVLEWTLYQVDVSVGAINVSVDLALAEAEGTTYIVLLQTAPEEYEALHATVFLPTLDTLTPIAADESDETLPYLVEEVTFDNDDVTLAGTLTLPPTDGPHPVVVLVSGSGPQDRDESLGGGIAIKPFRLLADGLTRAGVAVLRYDDRGVGESTGNFSAALVQDFASDAEAAISYLLTREDIDPDQIGLLGHSEGGLVAAMLGASSEDLDFIISLAGPGVNGRDVLLLQNELLLRAEGATQEQIDAQVGFVEALMEVLDDPEAIEELTYEFALEQAALLSEEERASVGDVEQYARAAAQQTAQQYSAGWFSSFINYDPSPDWAQTTIPVLAIFGGKDVQVDAEQNGPAIEAALEEAGNENYEVVVLPDANHLFQQAETGGLSEYGTLPAEFTPELLPTLIEWLESVVTIAE